MKTVLKLGTRRSLLAWAQSRWVAQQVEQLFPQIQVELIGIETRGDRIQDVPLQLVAGKEFFVAEIDEALLSGKVDFTVHSMKDLSLERHEKLICIANPKRENPRDVILFGPYVHQHLMEGKKLRIGTSSPRRIENIPNFLKEALPKIGPDAKPELEFVEIRGNVNTRLSRVHESIRSDKYLDGVVLAFAGLIRLWNDPDGQVELRRLLQNVRWMVLPLRECPAAPAQGALAVECKRDDEKLKQILKGIHDPATFEQIQSERQLLADWGGGCHQRFGATAITFPSIGNLLFIRGAKFSGETVNELRWKSPPLENNDSKNTWDGSYWRAKSDSLMSSNSEIFDRLSNQSVFVSHARAVQGQNAEHFKNSRIWTSGTSSWKKLAQQGIWVEGCAEGLGFEFLVPILQEKVLQLPQLKEWIVLTHQSALEEWRKFEMKAFSTYQVESNYGSEARNALANAKHIYWSSSSQLNELKEIVPNNATHACGPGKTANRLEVLGFRPQIFPSVEEWRRWQSKH
jgi:hydroxymethylbilane synthase